MIRTFESGSPAGDYSLDTGNGAYGAYQMRPRALQDAGAIISAERRLTDPNNWTGAYGKSLDDFLGTPENQDGAAAAYLDNYVVPAMVRTGALLAVGTSFTDSKGNAEWITLDGLLLAAWNLPGAAAGMVNGTASAPHAGTAQYSDTLSRFQAGAIVDGLTVSGPTARAATNAQAVITDRSALLFSIGISNALENSQNELEAAIEEEQKQLSQQLQDIEAVLDAIDDDDFPADREVIDGFLNELDVQLDSLGTLDGADLLDRLRSLIDRLNEWRDYLQGQLEVDEASEDMLSPIYQDNEEDSEEWVEEQPATSYQEDEREPESEYAWRGSDDEGD